MRQLLRMVRHPLKTYKQYIAMEKRVVRKNGIDSEKIFYVILHKTIAN